MIGLLLLLQLLHVMSTHGCRMLTGWVSHPGILQIVQNIVQLFVLVIIILVNDLQALLLLCCPQHRGNRVVLLLWCAAIAAALWRLLCMRYANSAS